MKKLTATIIATLVPLTSRAGDWEFSIAPYLWLPTIEATSPNVNGNDGISGDPGDPVEPGDDVGISVGPTDYLKALDFGIMIAGEARKDRLVLKAI